MKKILCVFLLAGLGVVYTGTSQAQGTWGVEAGMNFANINGEDFDTSTRAGFLFGVYYRMLLGDGPLYIQPELLYSQKGYEGASGNNTFKLDYIVAAALFAYYFETMGSVSPFVKAGPYIGINTTAKVDFDGGEQDLDNVNDTDVGVLLRAGVQVNKIEIGARLSQGITKVIDDSEFDARNFLFGFFVGLSL